MSVDTTTIKVGDKVRLRNGEVKTVSHITKNSSSYPVLITFDDDLIRNISYTKTGNWRYSGFEDHEDILEIIPAETSEETPKKEPNGEKVNLFEAEVGDTVIHEDGSKGTIKEIMKVQMLSGYDIALDIDHEDGRNTRLNYMQNGGGITHDSSQYIVRVVKPVKEEPTQDEMTLRDQFAMAALNGLLSNHQCAAFSFSFDAECVAKSSYKIADKMMKAR